MLVEVSHYKANQIPKEVLSSTRPLVMRGLVADWPVVDSCHTAIETANYLRQFDNGEPLVVYEVAHDQGGRVFYNSDYTGFNFSRSRRLLSNVLDQLFQLETQGNKDTLYVGSTMVDRWLPGFRDLNDLDLHGEQSLVSIWFGNQNRIAAHYDFPQNIACAIAGRRRFTLFPPDQFDNLYVGPVDFTPSGQAISLVDFANPDFVAHPNFKKALASSFTVELEPGDAIFIPSMWWHHVESLDDFNALINYWWRTTPVYHGSPNNVLQHAMLAIRNLPSEQKAVWKEIFETYVFSEDDSQFSHIPEQARGILDGVNEEQANNLRSQLAKFLK